MNRRASRTPQSSHAHYNRKPITIAEFDSWAACPRSELASASYVINNRILDEASSNGEFPIDSSRRRRKLNWRILPFQKRPSRPAAAESKLRDDHSVSSNTVSGRSLRSNHTFHSMQTEVAGNKSPSTVLKKTKKKTIKDSSKTTDAYLQMKQSLEQSLMNGKVSSPVRSRHSKDQRKKEAAMNDMLYTLQSQEDIGDNRTIGITKACRFSSPPATPPREHKGNYDGRPPLARNTHQTAPAHLEQDLAASDPHAEPSDGRMREQLVRLQNLSEGPRASYAHQVNHEPFRDDSSIVSNGSLRTQQLHMELNLRAMQELANRHLQCMEFEDAIEVWEEILRGQVQIYGYWHPRIGTVLHNLSLVHSLNKAFEHSAFLCSKAIDVRLATLGDAHLDLAESFAHLGIMRVETQQYDLAIQAFESALEIRRLCLEPYDVKISRLLNNIGCAYYETAQFDRAMSAFKEALEIQRFLMKTSAPALLEDTDLNSVGRVLLSIAATLSNIASIHLKWSDFDDSFAAVEEALLLQESVLEEGDLRVVDCKDLLAFIEQERSNAQMQHRGFFATHPWW